MRIFDAKTCSHNYWRHNLFNQVELYLMHDFKIFFKIPVGKIDHSYIFSSLLVLLFTFF